MISARIGRGWVATALVACAGVAHGQSLEDTPFRDRTRDPDLSVADRRHPELDPLGLRFGTIIATPTLDLGIQHDSNIYALDANPVGDTIATAAAALALRTDWSRNALALSGSVSRRQYLKFDSESTTDYALNGAGRIDVADGTIDLSVDTAKATEARTVVDTPGAADRPIRYHRTRAALIGEKPFGIVTARLGVDWTRYRFDDAQSQGQVLSQRFRDRDVLSGLARVDVALNPALAVYVDATANRRRYPGDTGSAISRNMSGYTVEFGADFDITRQVRGHIQGGYLSQTGVGHTSIARGPSGRGKIEWFAKPVLTVTIEGGRRIEDSARSDTAAYLSTDAVVRAEYELLRSLILTASGGYTWDKFQGIAGTVRRPQYSLAARYRMRRDLNLEIGYDHLAQRPPVASGFRSFGDSRITATIRLTR